MAAKDAIADLLEIMHDEAASARDRLNSAVSASRVSALAMTGEMLPPAVVFLRNLIDDPEAPTNHRREAAAALAYYQRRVKKAELLYNVADPDERREMWRRVLNSCIRYHCSLRGQPWKGVLLTTADQFQMPPCEPELAMSALLAGGNREQRRRLQRTIDERVANSVWSGTQQQRLEVVRLVAEVVHKRLLQFGLAA